MNRLIFILISSALILSCSQGGSSSKEVEKEDLGAKARMQGLWIDAESEDVSFRVKGDTIYYADSVNMPAYFRIIGDSLVLPSGTRYAIERLSEHLFWFKNQNGDMVKLRKLDHEESDSMYVVNEKPSVMTYTSQVKIDSVVNYNGARYHWYIAINPTKYKVIRHSYNDDGLEVEQVYYDNIMHISVYQGARQLYSSDFRKQQYKELVPAAFLEEAILANMEYAKADADGLHFNATLCIPDGASCYLVETVVSYTGGMTMKLVEY